MKQFAKLNLGLLSIVVCGIDRGYPSDSRCVPVIFCPLMIRDVELELSHDFLDCMMRSDLAQAEVGEDTMNNKEGCRATLGASERFLMDFKLLCVDRWIYPLQRAHGFHILILVIDNDYFGAKRVLHQKETYVTRKIFGRP